MDSVDKKILNTLRSNCRVQYQEIANDLNLSLNAVKGRVKKLVESGVIVELGVWLHWTVINAGYAFILANFNADFDIDFLSAKLEENPMTMRYGFTATNTGLIRVEYQGLGKLSEYATSLRKLEGVESIEVHPVNVGSGKLYEFSTSELRVLKCLKEDPRMPVSRISERTEISSKKISDMIQHWQEEHIIQFSADWNLNAAGSTSFYLKVDFDEKVTERKNLDDYMKEKYPIEYWGSLNSSIQPLFLAVFMVDHIRDTETISRDMKSQNGVLESHIVIPYPDRNLPGLCGSILDKMLEEIHC
ncbi:MAG: winged helix-turn-helix transcriptional regulator [Candidatus Thorarchaeota archaeon]